MEDSGGWSIRGRSYGAGQAAESRLKAQEARWQMLVFPLVSLPAFLPASPAPTVPGKPALHRLVV